MGTKKVPFTHSKNDVIMTYKRTLGAFQEKYEEYLREYGVPFDHTDDLIPEVFGFYFRLLGMRQLIRDEELLEAIHAEIAENNDYSMWED